MKFCRHLQLLLNALRAMQGAVCTIFMMVFGMTRPGGELTTYRVRGGYANH